MTNNPRITVDIPDVGTVALDLVELLRSWSSRSHWNLANSIERAIAGIEANGVTVDPPPVAPPLNDAVHVSARCLDAGDDIQAEVRGVLSWHPITRILRTDGNVEVTLATGPTLNFRPFEYVPVMRQPAAVKP